MDIDERRTKIVENAITLLKTMDQIPWGRLDELIIDWKVVDAQILPKITIKIKDSDYS